jgi:hypothetical protein
MQTSAVESTTAIHPMGPTSDRRAHSYPSGALLILKPILTNGGFKRKVLRLDEDNRLRKRDPGGLEGQRSISVGDPSTWCNEGLIQSHYAIVEKYQAVIKFC